jgi:hypothetical protein
MSKKPYKFTAYKRKEFLDLLSQGTRRGAAAKAIGITRQTVMEFIKDNPAFSNKISEAESDANELVEDALFAAACSGNVTATQVWLYNRDPDNWADRRKVTNEVTGKEGGDIMIKIVEA